MGQRRLTCTDQPRSWMSSRARPSRLSAEEAAGASDNEGNPSTSKWDGECCGQHLGSVTQPFAVHIFSNFRQKRPHSRHGANAGRRRLVHCARCNDESRGCQAGAASGGCLKTSWFRAPRLQMPVAGCGCLGNWWCAGVGCCWRAACDVGTGGNVNGRQSVTLVDGSRRRRQVGSSVHCRRQQINSQSLLALLEGDQSPRCPDGQWTVLILVSKDTDFCIKPCPY